MLKSRTIAESLYAYHIARPGEDTDEITHTLMSFLKRHHMVSSLPKILFHLKRIQEKDIVLRECKLTSSHELAKETVDILVKNIIDEDATELQVESFVDPSLIGGFILKQNGIIYDASIKSMLKKLEDNLTL